MSERCEIKELNDYDEVRFIPQGVCSKLMVLKIKDNKILDMETVGGCNGNLKGIGSLVIGMDIKDVISRLQGLPCGSRPTSCPDQLAQCLNIYIDEKSKVTA